MNQSVKRLLENLLKTNNYIFPSPKTGKRMIDLKRKVDETRKKAEIENLRFHDLRHTFATRMANAGVDIFITKRYAHRTEESKRHAVEKLVRVEKLRDSSVTKEEGQAVQLNLSN